MEVVAIVFAGTAGIIALAAIASILRGWVLCILWGWFMVPFGLHALSIPTAIGLALVVGVLTHQDRREPKDTRNFGERITEAIARILVAPFVVLGIGWIVKQFL